MKVESLDIQSLLQQHFPNLAEPGLQDEIIDNGQVMTFEEGEVIMDYESYIRFVPLVISGTIKVIRQDEEGHELFLYYLEPSDTCSMSFTCCMMNKRSVIKAVAEEETTFIAVPTRQVDTWMTKFISWKNFVMNTYDQRMLELVKVIDSIAFSNMDQRLMQYLEKRSKATNTKIINATHQEIAYDLNASREAVSRLLKRLEKTGAVELGRNVIFLA
jgi:CRP/FNR family transcriptional regulator